MGNGPVLKSEYYFDIADYQRLTFVLSGNFEIQGYKYKNNAPVFWNYLKLKFIPVLYLLSLKINREMKL